MDDSCAVCAETLEWVAYGPCGHREVCSTCVVRLRFILNDRRCCICKAESDVVFITKALGDYTRMINDFAVLPSELREGQVGSYWYHEDTQAFFDDLDHYKMVKAMCLLSCSVCDKDDQMNDGSKRRVKFRNIEQLKGHLFHRHRLLMCSLCLEGRKVFICEQKLYTRAQLNQHINTGDSEVDGSESERGGFMGHPMCDFCRTPFYGDNELYTHMSTEHYTCHMCQRQHPGQYEYYKNYDDLEIHFRREHFLCEDEGCLAKKFIVFLSEAEMKRHNAMEHGGRMSRAQRSAALQIPTSFRYKRSNEQDQRRGRGRTFRRDTSENQLSMAIEASLEMANLAGAFPDPSSLSSGAQVVSDRGDLNDVDPIIQPFESLATNDSELPSRYLQAVSHKSRNAPLEESSFPPLPMAPSSSQQNLKQENLPMNTMADRLRQQKKVTILNSGQPLPSSSRGPLQASSSSIHSRPMTSNTQVSSSSSGQIKPAISSGPSPPGYGSTTQAWPAIGHGLVSAGSSNTSKNSASTGRNRMSHSASAPNIAESMSFDPSISDFPPVSATQTHKVPTRSQPLLEVKDVQTANKSLVEQMRSALEFDEDKYTAFKEISGQYRQGLIGTVEYLAYVQQFGLIHLVLDLARLCPDPQKQKELIDTYNANMRSNNQLENGWGNGNLRLKDSGSSKKGKGKRVDAEEINSKSSLADSIMSTVRELQSSYKPSEVEVEQLSKDGYRAAAKVKSMIMVDQDRAELGSANLIKTKSKGQSDSTSGAGSNQNIRDNGGGGSGSKQRKKTSKFHRIRLGDGSAAAQLNLGKSDSDPDPELMNESLSGNKNPADGLTARGVWRSGGGQRLFSTAPKDLRK